MKITLQQIPCFLLELPNGENIRFFQAGAPWNGFIKLETAAGDSLIVTDDETPLIKAFNSVFDGGKGGYSVIKASTNLIEKLILVKETKNGS
jgi:hypothetical protein